MFQKFYELFMALNSKAMENCDEDLSLIEKAQKDVMDAWTNYVMSMDRPPDFVEMYFYLTCLNIVKKF